MEIREATPEDWPAIWPIIRDVTSAGETFSWPTDVGEGQARAMWVGEPPRRAFVAVDPDGSVAGTATMGPNHMGPAAHVATASFMVAAGQNGRGVGRALGEHVVEAARADGYRAMQFNAVVEANTRAVALWQSLGFHIIGTVPEAFHHPTQGYVGLHIMHRRL
jgi:L-amino acid N-acyltransferase YncA